MPAEIINGFGFRNGEHFKDRALALGLGVQPALSASSDLWHFTRDGEVISAPIVSDEAHQWLDKYLSANSHER